MTAFMPVPRCSTRRGRPSPASSAASTAPLRPNGIFWASYKAGTAEGHESLGRYYNYLDEPELRRHYAAAAQWQSLEIASWDGSGYDGVPTKWLGVTARK